MEAHDVFASEIGDGDDPFAGTDFGDFEQSPDVPADTADLPVVNAEGQQVGTAPPAAVRFDPVSGRFLDANGNETDAPPPGPGPPDLTPEQQKAEAAAYAARNAAAPVLPAAVAAAVAAPPPPTPVVPEQGPGVREPAPGPPPTPVAPAAPPAEEVRVATQVPEALRVTSEMRAAEHQAEQAERAAVAAEERGNEGEAGQQERVADALLKDELIEASAFAPQAAQEPAVAAPPPAPVPETPLEPQTAAQEPAGGATVEQHAESPEAAAYVDEVFAGMAEAQAQVKPEEGAVVPEPDVEDAPPPAEIKDEKGRTTHRPYVVLREVGPGRFEQVTWHEDKDGKMVPKGAGAKRQKLAMSRSTDDALVRGYKAVGAPEDGVMLVAVALSFFQVKPVKPKPPEPSRNRLQIG